jgi:TolA-binding protein
MAGASRHKNRRERIIFMDDQLRELKDRISQMSDDELLQIVEVEHDDYRQEALDFAKAELEKRNIPYEEPEIGEEDAAEVEDSDSSIPAADNLLCDVCGGKMRAGSLFADKELSIFFADKNEERFIQALACGKCGHLRLAVDFETDVEG